MAKQKEWWTRRASHLFKRDWEKVRNNWLAVAYVGLPIPPQSLQSLAELPSLFSITSHIDSDLPQDREEDVSGLKQQVIVEGVFLIFKAANALASAELDIQNGLKSWSISNAYHSAFFAAKAILHMFGIAIVEIQGRTYWIDVWSDDSRRKVKARTRQPTVTRILSVSRMEHRPVWYLLQRMLRITKVDQAIWPSIWSTTISQFDLSGFAKQRVKLHYHNTYWLFDDLVSFLENSSCDFDFEFADVAEKDDCTLAISFVLFEMAYRLLRHLAVDDRQIRIDFERLENALSCPAHESFRENIGSFDAEQGDVS